jgi:Skp family chaperone for outer membrane proteins
MRMLVKTLPVALLLIILSLTLRGQTSAPAGPPRLGYLSPQRIFAESTEGRAGVAKLQSFQQQRAAELQSKQQALQGTRDQLAHAADGEARTQLMLQEYQQRADLERANVQAQQDLQNMQRQMQAELQARVKSVLDELARGQNLQLVLNSDTGVVWSGPGLDLTSAVVERLNTSTPKP